MTELEEIVAQNEQNLDSKLKCLSSITQRVRPIPVKPRNIDFFGRLPYLPEPYSSLMQDVDRYTSQLRESAAAEREAGFVARTQLGLRPEDPRPYSTSINPSTSPNGAPPVLEETRALIMAVIA